MCAEVLLIEILKGENYKPDGILSILAKMIRKCDPRFESNATRMLLLPVVAILVSSSIVKVQAGAGNLKPFSAGSTPLLFNSPVLSIRGGQSSHDPHGYYAGYGNPQSTQGNDPENGFANYNPPTDPQDTEHIFQESVQERVEKWRQEQMAQQQTYLRPEQEMNSRDAQGRMKLIASVSKGSRAIIFFILMWRDIHLYELADQAFKGTFRLLIVTPLMTLFIGNMAGVVASFTQQSHASKKRMKAILNLDKLVEGALLVYYFLRLTVAPSKYVPREIFVARTLHAVIFMIQLQAFTRVSW